MSNKVFILNQLGIDTATERHEQGIHKAMDRYAQTVSIEFVNYISRNGYLKLPSGNWTQIKDPSVNICLNDVYKIFLNDQ